MFIEKTLFIYFLLLTVALQAQVKKSDNPTNSALELESQTKRSAISKVSSTASFANPENDMIINDLSSNCFKGYLNGVWSSCGLLNRNSFQNIDLAQISSQNRKGQFHILNDNPHQLYVCFTNELNLNSHINSKEIIKAIPEIKAIVEEFHITFEKAFSISDDQLQRLHETSEKISKNSSSLKKLNHIFKVMISNPSNSRLIDLASKLEKLQAVEYSDLVSINPIPPPSDLAPATPNFQSEQSYIQSNPGVNMQYAWNLGLNGAGIRIRDIEYGFNKNHEELNEMNADIAAGMNVSTSANQLYTEHGTCVFGVNFANNGIYGITGLAFGAQEMILFPEWQQSGYNRVYAVSQAIQNSAAGDVIIYEMQEYGENNNFVPAEFSNVIWDLTKAATDAGIIVVASAGNGSENLDSSFYSSYLNRGDSGAIIIGAGTPDLYHSRLSFSTYGSRVDVQGWGLNVLTTGSNSDFSNNWATIGDDFNQSYFLFGGTSSATAMVAACTVVLQSYYHFLTGGYLNSIQMRNLLIETGIPQNNTESQHIGPLPNMQSAIQEIYNDFLELSTYADKSEFMIYPNPCRDKITLVTNEFISIKASIKITNSLGQTIYNKILNKDKVVDISNLSEGIYYLELTDDNKSTVKKIIKK
ncbi:S8/S53 family peptidase [Flavobacterium sp.]|uniref:S8/S53 family peptidase n=1 Tax=Flavobacterium sp. TaxID=239 RepID=UPI00261B5505|nr:S8/S53 family peptidase [Flavobacterium sp.]